MYGDVAAADWERFAAPFYLHMMRTNVVDHVPHDYPGDLIEDVASAGREATTEAVLAMLRSIGWRERVMGAWLAVMQDDEQVNDAVLRALETSSGSLDAPPLTCAAVTLAGTAALPSIDVYARHDVQCDWGAAGFASAAAEALQEGYARAHDLPSPSANDPSTFAAMLDIAKRLRDSR